MSALLMGFGIKRNSSSWQYLGTNLVLLKILRALIKEKRTLVHTSIGGQVTAKR